MYIFIGTGIQTDVVMAKNTSVRGQYRLQEVLDACTHPVGLAIIISNDYKDVPTLKILNETEKDGKAMMDALKFLGHATVHLRNVTYASLLDLLRQAEQIKYPSCCRRVVFVFAGHGKEGDNLITGDGKCIKIQTIVEKLSTIPMARLFFIDACRGKLDDRGRVVASRGGKPLDEVRIPSNAYNFLLAHSTIPGHRSYEVENEGGIWMPVLANKLKEVDADINAVLVEVNRELQQRFQDRECFPYMMMPESINRLAESINLLKESEHCKFILVCAMLS